MNLKVHLRESILNLFSAKLRSILAILGVLVGTGSVVALMASSRLATDHALAQFKTLGTNLLAMRVSSQGQDQQGSGSQQNLSFEDVPKLMKAAPQVKLAAPYLSLYQSIHLFNDKNTGQVIGATADLATIAKIYLDKGRFISDFDNNVHYAVIGSSLAKQYEKHFMDPMGKQIRVGSNELTIIGVAKPWKPNLFLFINIDNSVIVPYSTAYAMQPNAKLQDVLFRLVKQPDLPLVQQQLTNELNRIAPNLQPQFRNPGQIIKLVAGQRKTFSSLLLAIGSIALVVGGIGVMNIMLVSVVERRREIGVRMAVGARRWDIMIMFLMEAIMLTVLGGLLGIGLGVGVTAVLAITSGWAFHIYWIPPLLGFFVSVLVGIISGFYPAWRAS
ncbi:MAG: ABC transporter permease, partial [Coxiellaceae bacterium]|nr:ABC transporter permease [Coxiellaceae bacterium]